MLRWIPSAPSRHQNKLYVYWMSTEDGLEPYMDTNFEDAGNIVPVRVPTSSHHEIIQKAYEDGHSVVLILTDEIEVSPLLFSSWEKIIVTAPSDWTILQMWTSNPTIQRHCESVHDPWIIWFPEHVSEDAYFINRQGMRHVLHNPGHIFQQGRTYTSTRFFVKSPQLFELSSSVQKWHRQNTSTLIVTTTVIKDQMEFEKELSDWQHDFHALSAKWHLTIIVHSTDMERHVKRHWPQWPTVTLHVEVFQGQYNKFTFVRRSIPQMALYKHVVIKDSDIALSGFPWQTFFGASKNAVVAGALRQIKHGADRRQWFQFQDGYTWKKEYARQFSNVQSHSVPFLEQFFVVMDGAFARWFFHRILTDAFLIHEDGSPVRSNWGPDTIWCGAAAEWTQDRTPCLLVPVIATHRDTRQVILWNSSAHRKYINMQQNSRYRQAFPQWLFYDSSNIAHQLEPV